MEEKVQIKKGKKKKRKADRQAQEAEAMTYIKPEPRSPSPMTAPSYLRPNKRQRHTQGQVQESRNAEPRYDNPALHRPQVPYSPNPHVDGRIPVGYAEASGYPQRPASAAVLPAPAMVQTMCMTAEVPATCIITSLLSLFRFSMLHDSLIQRDQFPKSLRTIHTENHPGIMKCKKRHV